MMLDALRRWVPARYVIVGAVAALMQNAIMILTDLAGLHFMIGNILCFFLVGTFSYLSHSRVTFQRGRSWMRYTRFMAGLLSGFFVASILFFLFCSMMHMPMPYAAPLVTVLMLFYNYFSAKWAIMWRDIRRT